MQSLAVAILVKSDFARNFKRCMGPEHDLKRLPWLCSGVNAGVATSRSQRRGRPLSGTALWCRDMPFPAKGAAAVGHQGLGARLAQTGV